MPEGVARRGFRDRGLQGGGLHGALHDGLVQVMAPLLGRLAVHVVPSCRKRPLPGPLSPCIRVLARERAGQLDPAGAARQVLVVLSPGCRERLFEAFLKATWHHGGAVAAALAAAKGDLVPAE